MSNISDLANLPKFFLSDYSKKDQLWDIHRANAQSIEQIYAASSYDLYDFAYLQFYNYSLRINKCSNILKFGFDDKKMKLKHAFFCRVRYCPVCQWRRSMMWRAKFFQLMPSLQEQYPTHRWVFLTLTVKNCHINDLRSTLKAMNVAWNKFVQYKELSAIDGFVRTTEVTLSKDGSAHPHFHVMLFVKAGYFGKYYVKALRYRELWQKALRVDYLPVVNIKTVKDPEKGVLETLKYSTKASDMFSDHNWFRQLTLQTHKLRFIATGGVLKDCMKDEDEITNEDMISSDTDTDSQTDDRRIAFYYSGDIRKYHRAPFYDENYVDKEVLKLFEEPN
jgi:plasmid rolling circle replication initiator protein Rep